MVQTSFKLFLCFYLQPWTNFFFLKYTRRRLQLSKTKYFGPDKNAMRRVLKRSQEVARLCASIIAAKNGGK